MRLILAWLGLIPVMILNGILRESGYGPSMSELRAHQLSTVIGVALFLAYTWFFFPFLRIDNPGRAWAAGCLWLILTVAFEFLFGHFVAGHSWGRLFRDYNLLEGRVWLVFLLTVTVGPWLVYQVRG